MFYINTLLNKGIAAYILLKKSLTYFERINTKILSNYKYYNENNNKQFALK